MDELMSDVTDYGTFTGVEEREHYYLGVIDVNTEVDKDEERQEGEEEDEEEEMGAVRGEEIEVEEKYYMSKTLWEDEEDGESEVVENEEKYYGWETLWETTDPSFYYLTPKSIYDPLYEEIDD